MSPEHCVKLERCFSVSTTSQQEWHSVERIPPSRPATETYLIFFNDDPCKHFKKVPYCILWCFKNGTKKCPGYVPLSGSISKDNGVCSGLRLIPWKTNKHTDTSENTTPRLWFPFFKFIYCMIYDSMTELNDQCLSNAQVNLLRRNYNPNSIKAGENINETEFNNSLVLFDKYLNRKTVQRQYI